jgi:hypothetical protein
MRRCAVVNVAVSGVHQAQFLQFRQMKGQAEGTDEAVGANRLQGVAAFADSA